MDAPKQGSIQGGNFVYTLIAGLYARKLKAISQTLALLIIVQSDVAMHKLIDPSWENLLYHTVVIVIVFA